MSEWIPQDEFSNPRDAVEDLLRMAAEETPSVRSGLKAEIVTQAQKAQREIRFQHFLWGGVMGVMLFLGGLIWWPANAGSALASTEDPPSKPALAVPKPSTDSVDWELVESKTQLRRRNLEILRNAF